MHRRLVGVSWLAVRALCSGLMSSGHGFEILLSWLGVAGSEGDWLLARCEPCEPFSSCR